MSAKNTNPINRGRTFLYIIGAALAIDSQTSANAYLDPGTGAMLLQLLLGGVAGALVVGKLYWSKFKGLFARQAKDRPIDGQKSSDQ